MRKICLWAFSLLVFLLIFNTSFAKENSDTSTKEASLVNYYLPYPGLLPDSPFYFLRVIRDRVISMLITNPLKESEFNLLQADKRLNAGIFVFNDSNGNENKINLSASTISKAENYFEKALGDARTAKEKGMNIADITKNLKLSSQKHQEVLESLLNKSPKNFKSKFETEIKRVVKFQKDANLLSSKR